jgi:D-alanyl-D-alanine carboxypeptidase/D-alanyl-D-alanine-endopeptidase (penicillin-binding protein 4)
MNSDAFVCVVRSKSTLERFLRRVAALLCIAFAITLPAAAQDAALTQRILQMVDRPIFRHSTVGVEVYDQTAGKTLVTINPQQLFTAGSTTKLVTEGSALALLGEDFRFHTRVFYTGNITEDGTLEGNLILVAGGDPNLSGRVMPDDTLDFTARDHAYAGLLPGNSVAGEPLRVMKELASGVLMRGIWRVRGNIIVDTSLFVTDQIEPATHTAISPVMLNDNVIDVIATSARNEGGPVAIQIAPELPYLKVINHVRTGKPNSDAEMRFTSDVLEADGSHTVVIEGNVPAGRETAQAAYKVKDPARYAEEGFHQALRWAGVVVQSPFVDPGGATAPRAAENRTFLVEHVSPPFKEEVKLTLKVSQNLHAATTPFLVGSLVGHNSTDAQLHGLALEHHFLAENGLDPESVSQLDGEGGVGSAFSPDFMVRYLEMISHRPYGRWFYECLPVLGRDGTLAEILQDSPAVGHVHAKTGSYVVSNTLNGSVMLLGKGLAGYVDGANGHRLIFAAFVNMVPLHNMDEVSDVGDVLAKIAAAAYESTVPPQTANKPPAAKAPTRTPGKVSAKPAAHKTTQRTARKPAKKILKPAQN